MELLFNIHFTSEYLIQYIKYSKEESTKSNMHCMAVFTAHSGEILHRCIRNYSIISSKHPAQALQMSKHLNDPLCVWILS